MAITSSYLALTSAARARAKAATKLALEDGLLQRAAAIEKETPQILNEDFTLRDLTAVPDSDACKLVAAIIVDYTRMQESFSARAPTSVDGLVGRLDEAMADKTLTSFVQELRSILQTAAHRVTVTSFTIEGNLPKDFRTDRDISGRLTIGSTQISLDRIEFTEETGLRFSRSITIPLHTNTPVTARIGLEQHLKIWSNPLFGGERRLNATTLFGAIKDTGLHPEANLVIPIAYDDAAGSLDEVTAAPTSGPSLTLQLKLSADRLPDLKTVPNCPAN